MPGVRHPSVGDHVDRVAIRVGIELDRLERDLDANLPKIGGQRLDAVLRRSGEHGAELGTFDRDFEQFAGLRLTLLK